jgi:hypothetical protein
MAAREVGLKEIAGGRVTRHDWRLEQNPQAPRQQISGGFANSVVKTQSIP